MILLAKPLSHVAEQCLKPFVDPVHGLLEVQSFSCGGIASGIGVSMRILMFASRDGSTIVAHSAFVSMKCEKA